MSDKLTKDKPNNGEKVKSRKITIVVRRNSEFDSEKKDE